MSDWLDALVRLRGRGVPATLVSVVSAKGSVPRGPGTRIVVTADAVEGTIGGGHLELTAIGIARDMLSTASARTGELRRFPLGAILGQCCGGLVNLLFEPIDADAAWVDLIASLRRKSIAVVVATPAECAAPGRLVVTADCVSGSIGDPALDASVVAAARALVVGDEPARLARFEGGGVESGAQRFRA